MLVCCQLKSVPRYDISNSDTYFRCVYSTLCCDGDGNLRILVSHSEWRVDGEKSIEGRSGSIPNASLRRNRIEEVALEHSVDQRRRQWYLREYLHHKFTKSEHVCLGELVIEEESQLQRPCPRHRHIALSSDGIDAQHGVIAMRSVKKNSGAHAVDSSVDVCCANPHIVCSWSCRAPNSNTENQLV